MNNASIAVALLIATLCTACSAGRPATPRPEAYERAEALLHRAVRAQQKNETNLAEELLLQSLAASSSIEEMTLQAKAHLNLARLYRLKRDLAKAASHAGPALRCLPADHPLVAEANYEDALIQLANRRYPEALDRARTALDRSAPEVRGARRNLVARILQESGQLDLARRSADTALLENRAAGAREEEANSLRTLGIVARLTGDAGSAGRLLQEALLIDKEFGANGKIGRDLLELAELAVGGGDARGGVDYLERAVRVLANGPRKEEAAEPYRRLIELHTRLGNTDAAQQARDGLQQLSQEKGTVVRRSGESATPSSKP